jgi:aldehyde:ferredoxin oxidoreductase
MKKKAYEFEPLNRSSPLIFMVGMLTGTAYPCSGFYSVSARSPLTEIYGEGLSGGFFGAELSKRFNGVIFQGAASNPVYLKIVDDSYELQEANDLWGLNTAQTMNNLQDKLGKDFKVACIGTSGEKQVNLASIINDHYRAVGRTGMGAIMGAKNLKAIAVKSSNEIEYYNRPQFKEVSTKLFKSFAGAPMAEILKNYGTNNISYFERLCDVPHKNWTLNKWHEVQEISGEVVLEKLHVKNKPCYMCPFSCGREIEIREGPYKMQNAAGVEYETTAAFGAMCLVSDVNAIAYLNHICNLKGIDTISTGCTIAFALDCYANGLLTEEDIGYPLRWGDTNAIIKVTNLIADNQGIGRILSQGSRKAARIIGKGSQLLLAEIKGLEVPMHDPRAIFPLGLQYATSNRGACHLRGFANDTYSGFTGFDKTFPITKPIPIRERTLDNPGFAKDVVITQNISEINNALGICRQTISSGSQIIDNLFDLLLESIYHLTGLRFSLENLLEIGERIFNLKRVYNVQCGISRKDDCIPPKLTFPLEKGLTKNKITTIDQMLNEYYKLRGWDEQGIPTKEKLEYLNIERLN